MWSLVLHAWSKSGRPDAGSQADLIVQNLLVSGLPIDTAVYNAWMDCWTKSGDPMAVHCVQEILEKLERNCFNSRFNQMPCQTQLPCKRGRRVLYQRLLGRQKSCLHGCRSLKEIRQVCCTRATEWVHRHRVSH